MLANQKFPAPQADSSHSGDDPSKATVATRRVLGALERAGVPFTLKLLPEGTQTPEQIAECCEGDVRLIVLSVIYRGKTTKKPFLLLHSATSKLNDRNIGTMVGENLQRADADFAARLTGYTAEAIPPLAHLNRVPVMLDDALLRFARVWCPAGSVGAIVSIPTLVLARAVSARIVDLTY